MHIKSTFVTTIRIHDSVVVVVHKLNEYLLEEHIHAIRIVPDECFGDLFITGCVCNSLLKEQSNIQLHSPLLFLSHKPYMHTHTHTRIYIYTNTHTHTPYNMTEYIIDIFRFTFKKKIIQLAFSEHFKFDYETINRV